MKCRRREGPRRLKDRSLMSPLGTRRSPPSTPSIPIPYLPPGYTMSIFIPNDSQYRTREPGPGTQSRMCRKRPFLGTLLRRNLFIGRTRKIEDDAHLTYTHTTGKRNERFLFIFDSGCHVYRALLGRDRGRDWKGTAMRPTMIPKLSWKISNTYIIPAYTWTYHNGTVEVWMDSILLKNG